MSCASGAEHMWESESLITLWKLRKFREVTRQCHNVCFFLLGPGLFLAFFRIDAVCEEVLLHQWPPFGDHLTPPLLRLFLLHVHFSSGLIKLFGSARFFNIVPLSWTIIIMWSGQRVCLTKSFPKSLQAVHLLGAFGAPGLQSNALGSWVPQWTDGLWWNQHPGRRRDAWLITNVKCWCCSGLLGLPVFHSVWGVAIWPPSLCMFKPWGPCKQTANGKRHYIPCLAVDNISAVLPFLCWRWGHDCSRCGKSYCNSGLRLDHSSLLALSPVPAFEDNLQCDTPDHVSSWWQESWSLRFLHYRLPGWSGCLWQLWRSLGGWRPFSLHLASGWRFRWTLPHTFWMFGGAQHLGWGWLPYIGGNPKVAEPVWGKARKGSPATHDLLPQEDVWGLQLSLRCSPPRQLHPCEWTVFFSFEAGTFELELEPEPMILACECIIRAKAKGVVWPTTEWGCPPSVDFVVSWVSTLFLNQWVHNP